MAKVYKAAKGSKPYPEIGYYTAFSVSSFESRAQRSADVQARERAMAYAMEDVPRREYNWLSEFSRNGVLTDTLYCVLPDLVWELVSQPETNEYGEVAP